MEADAQFAILAEATRRRMLLSGSEFCACELLAALEADQPKVSRHLPRMRTAGLVEDRRAPHWKVCRVHGAGQAGRPPDADKLEGRPK